MLPGDALELEVLPASPDAPYTARAASGELRARGPHHWRWTAPQAPGLYPITLRPAAGADSIRLNAFVMVPFDRLNGESLNGYRIGRYPSAPLRGLPIYRAPRGFVEVTRENAHTLVAPNFTLAQFLCKQQPGHDPKYVVLQESLLLKLEAILERVNERGHRARTFQILSGYRTPSYNRAIGNVTYSRHAWGDAADIFIDEDGDGLMDDLNGDGKIDERDAAVLHGVIDALSQERWYRPLLGGLGRYGTTKNHGPFVHIDARGTRARW